MGIFSGNYGYTEDYLSNVRLARLPESATVMEATLMTLAEANTMWYEMMQETALREMAVLEATGQEMVYEAVDVREFFGKVVQWFKNMWAKISAIIGKFLTNLGARLASDKKIVEKYKKTFEKGYDNIPAIGFSVDGYKYDGKRIDYGAVYKEITRITSGSSLSIDPEDLVSSSKSLLDTLRGIIADSSDELTETQFVDKLKEKLQGQKITVFNRNTISKSDLMDEMRDGKETKKQCKKAYDELKRTVNEFIKNTMDLEKESTKGKTPEETNKIMKVASGKCSLYKSGLSIAHSANGVELTCLSKKHAFYKSIVLKCIKQAGGFVKESATYESESFEELFSFDID